MSLRGTFTAFFCALFAVVGVSSKAWAQNTQEWASFKGRYVSAEGRVIDTVNGGISHSEGQGAGMLLAVFHDDRAAFNALWAWTRAQLQIRDDRLFAWKWDPEATPNVGDKNNASDGDILIAWALYLGFQRWGDAELRAAADDITRDIREKLLRKTPQGLILLPGAEGFENTDGVTVNLSYWVFPAFAVFEKQAPDTAWRALRETGLRLLRQARFGKWRLPPDWLRISGSTLTVAPAPFNPRFGYDAVRIPLYLIWAGLDTRPLLQPYVKFWNTYAEKGGAPAWIDLDSGATSPYEAPAGFYAVIDLTRARCGLPVAPRARRRAADEEYYPALLGMLAHVARRERGSKNSPS